MVVDQGPVLTYLAAQFRVRVEVSRLSARSNEAYSPDLIQRAKAKLEQVQASGKIALFTVNEQLFKDVWEKLRAAETLKDSFKVSFTLAAGSPPLPGLHLEKGPNEKSALLISMKANPAAKSWAREWIKTTILFKAKELGITDALSAAQLQACINRIVAGEALQHIPIPLLKSFPLAELQGKTFGILANKARGELTVIINDIRTAADPKTLQTIQTSVIQAVDKLNTSTNLQFQFHRQDMISCIQGAASGPESLGVSMPLMILAASASPQESSPSTAKASGSKSVSPPPNQPRFFDVVVSEDRMKAHIKNFKPELYTTAKEKTDRTWFESQLKMFGVVAGYADDIWQRIEEALLAQKSLNDMLAAEGNVPIPGNEPYLHLVYKDAPKGADTGNLIDIREAQQRNIVKAGQCIAEIRFKKAPIPGKTVTGHNILPPLPDSKIALGQGVVQKEAGKYYATIDGLPVWESPNLSVTKIFVHNGDVDLKSGNIRFDGPVEIKGSIDSGATVDVTGPLIVHGMIRAAFVYSKSSIEVRQGICTTEKGFIKSKGDIQADFIENSTIHCGSVLKANKAILNSRIFAVKSVLVMGAEGIIGGGMISCRDALLATNLGFPSGAKTKIIVGTDVRALHRVTSKQARVEKLKAASERYRSELRELTSKRAAQMTEKHKQRKEKLQVLLNKVKVTIDTAQIAFEQAKSVVTFNTAAIIAVSNKLSTNVDIEIANISVPVVNENLGAAITPKKRKDGYICAIEDVKAELDRTLASVQDTSQQQANKAS